MPIKKILPLFITCFILAAFLGNAQETNSSLSGVVKTKSGAPMVGATVTATHGPTGTVYRSISRQGGRFEMSNMNPGGPYNVSATFVGSETQTRNDVFLVLGEGGRLDFDLSESAKELTAITISGTRAPGKTGTETTISRDILENIPTVGRTLSDYLRATPQLKLSGAGGGASGEGGMSFAGQNVRYNSFYIDGAVNNDVFGLAYTGTNGGQSGIAPISIDAIDQFQVSISPYNASMGNFTGGAINAITKSGTNEFHGSAYYIFRNETLAGKTPNGPKDSAVRIPNFDNKTYGITLGGPIVKNKIFYFISAEMQRDQSPVLFSLGNYVGTKTPATFQRLVDTIRARSNGFDVGGYLDNLTETKSDRLTAKIDWNLSQRNKLSLSYRYTSGDRIIILESGPTQLRFGTNGYRFPTKTHSVSAELRSTFGQKNMSNRFLFTLTDVEDDRGPLGSANPIPQVQIFDGPTASIYFGTEANSTFNYLKQTTFNFIDHFKFNVGKHYFTLGAEVETYKAFNSFISNTAGNYRYDSLQAFYDNKPPNQYIVNYPNFGGTEKNTKSAADFDIFKGAAFINDEIRFNKNLTVTLGVRADYYKFLTDPISDPFVKDSALAKFAQYHDLKGAMPDQVAKIPVSISPRVGFTYQIPSENITIRGGFGWFTGRIPLVWPSAIYNNNGIAQGGYTLNATQNAALRDKITFRVTPYTAEEIGLSVANANLSNSKGTLVLIAKEFRTPKVFRSSIAFDKRLGLGWTATIEAMFTKNVNDVYYRNINLLPPTLRMATGPDTRTIYPAPNTIPIRAGSGINPYQAVYLISNAQGQKPFSYNFTVSLNKTSRKGLNMSLNYNFGGSEVLNEAQSSTPGSQWNSMETVNGRNDLTLSTSDNSVGHRIFSYISKKFTYANEKLSTTISLTYTGQSGQPFSYVYSGTAPVRDGQNNNDLIFVPTASQLQAMTFITAAGVSAAPEIQKAAFETFIQNDKYLSSRRGQYAERNGSRIPFQNVVDLKITQNFYINVGKRKYSAEVAYSMFNFTNFLNRDWGRQHFVNFDNYGLLSTSYVSATNLTPRYTFNPTTPVAHTLYNRFNPTYSARWMSQLEFRIRF